jgi:hypothetical protein
LATRSQPPGDVAPAPIRVPSGCIVTALLLGGPPWMYDWMNAPLAT